jgi:hypothetical protein
MSDDASHLKLDPWAASSLLQKAIRRGEVDLAKSAASLLHRYRGVAVWRRLIIIAVEDIGIADLDLVGEVVQLATNKEVRAVLASDADLLSDVCSRLAAAPKDRSADYLMSAATLSPAALRERRRMLHLETGELLDTAANAALPLIERAVAALLACTGAADQSRLRIAPLERLLASVGAPESLGSALLALTRAPTVPFVLMLPLLWSAWQRAGGVSHIVGQNPPEPEYVGSIPLYVFDKHTAAGKQAIAIFARTNSPVRRTLARHISSSQITAVAEIAAFYADAAPVTRRLEWAEGLHLERAGLRADMIAVGCPLMGIETVTDAVRDNLADLNAIRKAVYVRQGSRK